MPLLSHVSNVAFIVCSALNKARGIRRAPQRPAEENADCTAPPDVTPLRPADVAAAIAGASRDAYAATMSLLSPATTPSCGSVFFKGAPSGHLNLAVLGGVLVKGLPEPVLVEFLPASDVGPDGKGVGGGASSASLHKRARHGGGGNSRGSARRETGGVSTAAPGATVALAHSWRVDTVPADFDEEAFELYKKCAAWGRYILVPPLPLSL